VFALLLGALALLKLEPHFLQPKHILKLRVLLWVIVGLFASFMMTKASYPLGRMIPKIEIGIFTWRMLSITTLLVALIAGACVQAAYNAFKHQSAGSNSIVSLAALIIIAGALFTAVKLLPPLYHGVPFQTAKEHLNFVMIPRTAPEDPLQLPKVKEAEFAKGN